MNEEKPYIEKVITTIVRLYNPNYGSDRVCICGHTYERHFDWMEPEDYQDVGCKYCHCNNFQEKVENG